ncbi:MAG: hypothetical protein GEU74_01285 [Nitriliruptorales bacterium]|nr:hypothetical protein [Nitriliruptorales bacterium]
MRRRVSLALVFAVVAAAVTLPATALEVTTSALPVSPLVHLDPGAGYFTSPNLEYIGTLRNDAPGVGARVLTVDGQKRLYMTGVRGLSIYDVDDPAQPQLLGHLEIPHWENEDVTVSRDGRTVLMSEFMGTYMHVVEVRDLPNGLLLPVIVGFTEGPSGHIVDCVDDGCDWVYGSEGVIIDLRDKTNPVVTDRNWARLNGLPTNGHNLQFDDTGLLWTDTTPISALDVSDPLNPVAIVKGDKAVQTENRTAYQHNNLRPNARLYKQRGIDAKGIKPGALLMGNGETNFSGTCQDDSGPFSTYRIKDMTPGTTDALQIADVFRPVSGDYADGNPAVNGLGCSGHWFTIQPEDLTAGKKIPASYDVAAAWYEHGTRLLNVDASTGEITQKGYFQPVVGAASAAYWIDNEYIYVVDYERGIDVLRFDANARVPTTLEFDASWLAKAGVTSPLAERERYLCRLVTQG